MVGAGIALLIPALVHGVYLGPYDILSTNGLTAQHGAIVHNSSLRDQIALFIPFTEQVWTQVHQGHLPLWNPDSGLGMPLAFNWESAPFGLPALVGYLFPMRFAYTVGIIVTVVVAGTGGYVFGRVLRLGVIASAFVGTVFVLCGSMVSLLGWSATSVGSWAGWLFATAVLVIRGRHRARSVAAFALVIAMTLYAGHPETALLVFLSLAVFIVVVLACRVPRLGAPGPIRRPAFDIILAGVAGAGLAAPLLLPGMQLISQSGRSGSGNYDDLTTPDHGILQLIFQGFDGLPTAGSHWFGSLSYQWTAAYVGVIALAMAIVALGARWKRPEVRGVTAAVVLMSILVLVPGVPSLVNGLPLVGEVILTRALIPLGFGAAVLGGFGLDALIRSSDEARVRRLAAGSFVVLAVALALVWLFGRGHLPADEARIRAASFWWPFVGVLVGFAVIVAIARISSRPDGGSRRAVHLAAVTLLAFETAFLVTAGAFLLSSNPGRLTPTPAVQSLQKTVGSSLVGLGTESCIASTYLGGPGQGILAQANVLYNVHELAMYDPLAPAAYYSVWHSLTGQDGGSAYYYQFCPAVSSVKAARRFGVAYVLEEPGAKGPVGSHFVKAVGGNDLYAIPGAAAATVVPAADGQNPPPSDAVGRPIGVRHPDPATWQVHTDSTRPEYLRLRVTDVPGWHGTIDGHPLSLQSFSGLMLQVRVPAGRHTVTVSYWPTTFTDGIVVAVVSALGLGIALGVETARSRRRRSRFGADAADDGSGVAVHLPG